MEQIAVPLISYKSIILCGMVDTLSFFIKYAKFRYRIHRVILRLKIGKKKRDQYLKENEVKIVDFLPEIPYIVNGVRVVPRKFTNDFDLLAWPREEIIAQYFTFRDGETFVDVGANVGKYCLYIAKDNQDKSVNIIAIEAHPENYKALCKNIELNRNFKNRIKPINKAVSDHRGKVMMYENLGSGHRARFETFTIIENSGISENKVAALEVECDTLDNILANVTQKVDVMKIDIEGAEVMALKSATKTLRQLRSIIVEVHDYHFEDIRKILEGYNFNLQVIKENWGEKGEVHGYIIGQKVAEA